MIVTKTHPSHPIYLVRPTHTPASSADDGGGIQARKSHHHIVHLSLAEQGIGPAAGRSEGDGIRDGLHPPDVESRADVRRFELTGEHHGVQGCRRG